MKLNRVGISSLRIVNYFWTSRLGKCAKCSPICPSVSHSGSQSVKCPVIASQSICGSFRLLGVCFSVVSRCLHHGWIYDLHKKSLANSFPTFTFCLPRPVFDFFPLCLPPELWTFHLQFSMRQWQISFKEMPLQKKPKTDISQTFPFP